MHLPTRRLVAALSVATALSLVTACGGATPGTSQDASAWLLTGGVHEKLWKNGFDEWNADHPDTPIDYEAFANDAYKERIRTAIGAGTDPTLIFSWGGGTLEQYVAGANVVDLTADTRNVVERVLPSVVEGGMIGEKVYAIPNGQSQPVILYVNEEVFATAGAEVPTTWDELIAVVETFSDAGITPFAIAGQSRWPYLMWIQYLTDRIGGPEVFQAVLDGKPDAWSDPAILQALEHIQQLVEAGGFGKGYGSVSADANADVALLHTGKAAMLLQGSWSYSTFKADAPEWVAGGHLGTTPFPSVAGGTGDPTNIVGNTSNYWSVSAHASAEHARTATTFLDEYVFDDDYTQMLIEGGGVPPIVGIEDQLAQQDDAEFLTMAYAMVRDAPHFQLSWDQALPPDQAQELLTNLDQVFLLQISPAQFVTAMNATL